MTDSDASKRRRRMFFAALLTVPLLGCVASGPRFTGPPPVPADKARVVVYRHAGYQAGGVDLAVLVDGIEMAQLKAKSWATAVVEPGRRAIGFRRGSSTRVAEVTVDVEAGSVAYVNVALEGDARFVVIPTPGPVVAFWTGETHWVAREVGEKGWAELIGYGLRQTD